jgi:hypothetical protein
VLRQHLAAETVHALAEEFDRAQQDAFGARLAERGNPGGGIPGHYLPVGGPHTPVSRRLVEDDALVQVAEELLDGAVLPAYPEATLFYGQTSLHRDDGTGVIGLKIACYLEPLQASNGALRLLPGSQHADYSASLSRWQRQHATDPRLGDSIAALPMCVADSEPGDLIVFDRHTWHASLHGGDRRQWSICYLKDPQSDDERRAFARYVAGEADWFSTGAYGEPYDQQRYPFYDPAWLARVRPPWARRLDELGVFAAFGLG